MHVGMTAPGMTACDTLACATLELCLLEEEPAPISRGALEGEVSSQMTADSRATLVQRGLLPTPGGMVEAMIQDAVTGALPDSALYGELHFTPEAGP